MEVTTVWCSGKIKIQNQDKKRGKIDQGQEKKRRKKARGREMVKFIFADSDFNHIGAVLHMDYNAENVLDKLKVISLLIKANSHYFACFCICTG